MFDGLVPSFLALEWNSYHAICDTSIPFSRALSLASVPEKSFYVQCSSDSRLLDM